MVSSWKELISRTNHHPLVIVKDGMITNNNIFQKCENLVRVGVDVDLVEGALQETNVALQLQEWRNDHGQENDMDEEIH